MRISVITATLNNAKTITSCLDSLDRQTVDVQHIIVDGGSTDNTLDIIRQRSSIQRKIISEDDEGMYDAMNKGINMADGDIIGILNADDFYSSKFVLERVVDVLTRSSAQACYGDLIYVDQHQTEKTIRYWRAGKFSKKKFYWGWMVPHPTFFVKKDVYEKFGTFNVELGSAADYELMLRFLFKYEIPVAYIPEVLVTMRTGGTSNQSVKNRIAANLMDRKAWRVNDLKPFPWTLAMKPLRKLPQWFIR